MGIWKICRNRTDTIRVRENLPGRKSVEWCHGHWRRTKDLAGFGGSKILRPVIQKALAPHLMGVAPPLLVPQDRGVTPPLLAPQGQGVAPAALAPHHFDSD